ncbi:MAG: hypothetical protein H0V05_11715 [Euzebyaceae bacterium]|nr:hypothetical protein [Euzebyaceae bacterium]
MRLLRTRRIDAPAPPPEDGRRFCRMCGAAVVVTETGHCQLGHVVPVSAAAEQAVAPVLAPLPPPPAVAAAEPGLPLAAPLPALSAVEPDPPAAAVAPVEPNLPVSAAPVADGADPIDDLPEGIVWESAPFAGGGSARSALEELLSWDEPVSESSEL